ncbi:hypothetical protein ACQP2T_61830 [Nonomuraea sp. CA-143628]|uniref:hypothetical protein n=1 Tax=Nonomuraea sp. CA-143628 TaxID=3239997 RepID=UPI003D91CF09
MADEDDSISAGRIELEVVADLGAGWGGKLQKRIDAEIKGVKAHISAEIDAARVEVEAKAAAEAAERVAKIRMQVEIDNAAARSALAGLSGTQSVTVRADVDDAAARAQIADLGRDTKTTIRPEVDDGDAQARIAVLEQKLAELAGKGRRDIPVSVNVQGAAALGQALTMLAQVPFMVSGLAVLASTAVSAGSGLFALAAGAAQAVGALGALPGLAGAAVQGLGTMLLGLSGVSEAVNALSSAQASGGQSASAYAAAQEAAAERIQQAQRAIRDANHARMLAAERTADAKEAAQAAADAIVEAEQRVADAVSAVGDARTRVGEVAAQAAERQEDAAYRVEQAERRYAEAQRAGVRATEALNDARRAAKERLEDLELAVRGGALDEEGAALAVERAKQRLDKVVADPFAKDLDKKEADLAYRQALQRLDEVRERNGDLRDEQTEANAKGVEGSDEVTAAKERIAAAAQAEKDAEHALAEAREDAAKAAVDGARAIVEAQRGVTEAMKRVRDAEKDVEQAKKAEERSRRDVREALWNEMLANERLVDSKKELAKAQKAAAEAAKQQGAGVSAVAKAMDNLSPAGQRFARFVAGTLQPRMKELRFAVQEALLPGLQEAIERGMPMLDTLEDGLADTGREIGEVAKGWGKWVGSKEFRTDLGAIMQSNTKIVGIFGRTGKSALKGVMDILVVGAPYAEKLAGWIERGARNFATWTKTAREDGSMAKFFGDGLDRAKQLWQMVKDVGAGILALGKVAAPSGGTLLDDLSAAAKDFREWANDPDTQQRAQKFFNDSVTVLRSLGRLLKEVVALLGNLTDTVGGDSLSEFIDTLTAIVGWLNKLAKSPVTGEIIKWTLYLSGVALAIGLIIGKVNGLIKVFSKIPGVTKLVKALGDQVGKLAKTLSKMSGLSKLLGKLPSFGGGDSKDGKDSKRSTKVGTMTVQAGKVYVNGKTTTTSSKNTRGKGSTTVNLPDGDDEPRKKGKRGLGGKLKTGGKGAASLVAGVAASIGLDALMNIDWAKELPKAGGKLSGLASHVKGSVVGTIAGLLVDPIADAFKGDANKGVVSAIAEAFKSGSAGAGIGSLVGSIIPGIGTAIGGAIGGALGAVKGGISGFFGERISGAGLKNAFSLDGIASMLKEAGKLFGGAGLSIQERWANLWQGLDRGTSAGAAGVSQRLGGFLDVAGGKFVDLAKGAPKNIQDMWADIKRDLDAGISPSQAKLDAFAKAGGVPFLNLGKNAPKELQEGWRQAMLGIDSFTSIGAQKLGNFANSASGKFLELKTGAPASVQGMFADIQAKIAAGVPVPQKLIDDFVAAGGGQFTTFRKDAPQAVRDMLGDIQRDLGTGLAQASLKMGTFVKDGGGKFLSLRQSAPKNVKDMWADIQRDIDAGKQPSQAKLDAFAKAGGIPFVNLSKNAPGSMKKAWGDISAQVDPGLAPAKKKVAETTKEMEKSFGTAKSGIAKIWEALPDGLKTPIRWVINTGYGTIRRMWNGIAGAVGLPQLPEVSANFAQGGIVGTATSYGVQSGYSPGRDRLLAMVGEGESWLRPELTRALGPQFIDGGNRAARTGGVTGAARFLGQAGMAFASGGTVGKTGATPKPKTKTKTKELSPLEKILQGVSSAVRGVFSKGLGAGARATLNPIKNAIVGAVGNRTALQRLVGAIPRKVIDAVIARFDGKDKEINRDSGGVLPRGRSVVNNSTGRDEWVLTPEALEALGGPKAVQALNERGAAALYRGSRAASRAMPAPQRTGDGTTATVIVHAQPGQNEVTIGEAAARRLGALVGSP